MTKKDYKVTCSIIASICSVFDLSPEDEIGVLNISRGILSDSYDKFNDEEFEKMYEMEKEDLETVREEKKEVKKPVSNLSFVEKAASRSYELPQAQG